jgi:hypothetical protein
MFAELERVVYCLDDRVINSQAIADFVLLY